MKTSFLLFVHRRVRLWLFNFVLLGLAALPTSARAQAMLTFTGGNGAPLVITLGTPISFTITQSYTGTTFIALKGLAAASTIGNGSFGLTSTSQLSAAGSNASIYSILGGYNAPDGSVKSASDLYFQGTASILTLGQTATLTAGTFTTTGNFADAPPTNGSYRTFLFRSGTSPNVVSADGTSVVPEPSTWAMLTAGALLGLVLYRHTLPTHLA